MTAGGLGTRRLRGLGVLVIAAGLLLAGRLVQIQIFQHEHYLSRAQGQWKHRIPLPARRGNIYDREGRPLALSVTTWRVGVSTEVVADAAAVTRTLAEALSRPAGEFADRLRRAGGRHVVVAPDAVLSVDALAALRRESAITLERLGSRSYPFGGAGASLIGFHRGDAGGEIASAGLERGLDRWLAGTPGEAWEYESAVRGRTLGKEILRHPRDGSDVVLTLDADLQQLSEELLAEAIDECNAEGGVVLIVDPADGSVLAAADSPVMRDRSQATTPAAWDNFNFTGVYEPGSVFKIFTAASLLGRSAITASTSYDCDDEDFGSFHIRNSEGHDFGVMDFDAAFTHSANVYFARAVSNLRREELYRDLCGFGFGAPTRFPYPGGAHGLLKLPEDWSGRTKSTVAIGQEIAVTPLQLALAAAVVANGGVLYSPRIIAEIRGRGEAPSRPVPENPRGRVISSELAAELRTAMTRVVDEGTGVAAGVPWIGVAGKTGTAQKAKPGVGYVPGAYMSSFLAFVPADAPRLVILTMIDEPDYTHHYASLSAAPLCGRIIDEIGLSTDWLSGLADGDRVAAPGRAARKCTVPDLLHLGSGTARALLRDANLRPSGDAGEGVVVAQVPAAGARCPEGTPVELTVATPDRARAAADQICPDLRGLSNREVRRSAARLGIDVAIEGTGYVVAQDPAPGRPLGSRGLRVRMEERWR